MRRVEKRRVSEGCLEKKRRKRNMGPYSNLRGIEKRNTELVVSLFLSSFSGGIVGNPTKENLKTLFVVSRWPPVKPTNCSLRTCWS